MNLTGRGVYQKGQKPTKTKLRTVARDRQCTLRLDGCVNDTSTVVLCHIRRFGWAGTAGKPHDILGIHACAHCHSLMDSHQCSDTDVLRGLGETLLALVNGGEIIITGEK